MLDNVQKGEYQAFDASAYRVGIVVADFNIDITSKLLGQALATCAEYKIPESNITVHHVPGCVEIPLILKTLALKKFNCLVALGTIIRGETPHFDYVAKIVSEGVLRVTLDHTTPIGFGVLTCDTHEQALARVATGGSATVASLHSAKILHLSPALPL